MASKNMKKKKKKVAIGAGSFSNGEWYLYLKK